MIYLWYLAVVICGSGNEIYQTTFQIANEAYYSGDFSRAIENYLKLIQSGVEEDVIYYNLGNAFYHSGKKGLAIACYHYALDLNPSLSIAKENLEKVLNETQRKLALPEEPLWWRYLFIFHYGITKSLTWAIAIMFWSVGWLICGIIPWLPLWFRNYGIFLFITFVILGIVFICSGLIKEFSLPGGVLIVEKADAHVLPSENSPSRFELYEGDRFWVEKEEGNWALVKSVGNEKGWVKDDNMVIWSRLPRFLSPNIGLNR